MQRDVKFVFFYEKTSRRAKTTKTTTNDLKRATKSPGEIEMTGSAAHFFFLNTNSISFLVSKQPKQQKDKSTKQR